MRSLGDFLDGWLARRAALCDVPGFSVGVTMGRSVIFAKAYGQNSSDQPQQLTSHHMFPIGSQAKMITATAILQLAEQGLLQLDEPVAAFLPWLQAHTDPHLRQITVQQLLWHGAGIIRDGQNADYWQLARPFPHEPELRSIVLGSHCATTANRKVKYSNIGYALLGQIIETITRKSYGAYCRGAILRPLGLVQSIQLAPLADAHLAVGHTRPIDGSRIQTPAYTAMNALSPATGWYATSRAMSKLMCVLATSDDRLLPAAVKERMRSGVRNHWRPYSGAVSYGLGLQAYTLGAHTFFGHGGTAIGHRSFSFFHQSTGLSIAIMANAKDAPVQRMGHGIAEACLYFLRHGQQKVPRHHKRFEGTMANLASTVQIIAVGKQLLAVFPDEWNPFLGAEELRVTSANTLWVERADNLAAEDEEVRFTFKGNKIATINYAGITWLPERLYRAWLEQQCQQWDTKN